MQTLCRMSPVDSQTHRPSTEVTALTSCSNVKLLLIKLELLPVTLGRTVENIKLCSYQTIPQLKLQMQGSWSLGSEDCLHSESHCVQHGTKFPLILVIFNGKVLSEMTEQGRHEEEAAWLHVFILCHLLVIHRDIRQR